MLRHFHRGLLATATLLFLTQTGTRCRAEDDMSPVALPEWRRDTVCPINCNFEKNLCGWQQIIQDSFDWTRYSGATPTNGSGPNHDHTTGAGFYMYIEGDSVTHGDPARLLSSECHYNGPVCLNFWYHMHGSATAMALNVYVLRGNYAAKVWSMRNNQGLEWQPGNIDINVSSPFQIIVEGIRGSDALSDVAIDDISIHVGACSSSPGRGNEPPSTAEVLPSASACSLNCSFDSNLCRWNQMRTDAFDWAWQSGSTPTLMTGPSADHTGDGHYIYIEASRVSHGDTARLISSECFATGPQCLQFWYHMYGSADTMGLHVYLLQGKKADAIWRKRNDQGNMWHLAQVDMTVTRSFQIIFEGRRGSNDESDVAIDDVTLYPGQCSELSEVTTHLPEPDLNATVPAVTERPAVNVTDQTNVTARPPEANVTLPLLIKTTDLINEAAQDTPSNSVCQLNCNFEENLCQWSQLLVDVFDWTRHRGPTPTVMTGPSSDHTTGYGHYLYVEANSASYGDTARLISSECSATGPHCLQFWYHMYGSADTMGLHVYLLQDNVADAILWMRNDQGNVWHLAQVDFTTAGPFQIIFEGRRGSNDQSDVALDDVSLYRGSCADLAKPTLPPSATDSITEIISNVTQPQNTNSTTTTNPTGANTQTTIRPKTSNPNASPTTTTPAATVTIRPQGTVTATPSSTDHQVDEETEEPGPQPTAEEITPITYPKTTATPVPPTTESNLQTSVKPETPPGTVTQSPTTSNAPQPPTAATNAPQSASTVNPQHPNETQAATTVRPQPPTTTPSCLQNSHYTACISACGPTCRYVTGPPHCNDTEDCEPGCVCDDGYVLRQGACVPVQQCGCVDRDGNRYSFGQLWYSSHCSHKCQCQRQDGLGEIYCDEEDECDGNAICLQNEQGRYFCQKTGFDSCLINGDPEYRTFDKMRHDFEGEHSYVLVQTKKLPSNLPDIYIEGNYTPTEHEDSSSEEDDEDDENDGDDDSNEHDERHRLQGLTMKIYNHTVQFKKGQKLLVDGQKTKTPVSPTLGLKIQKHPSHISVQTDFGLTVTFDGQNDAEITLPRVYKRKVVGLCGNFDGRKLNDRTKPDGTMAKTVEEFGESWRV
ncbi:zonadhesin isoform X2 [Nerophis ophidion]|uniref:zonadhesin isoform X2 n=1 Tax=Nerophis ophidion TaxID=159077 RepID=UPI002ADF05F2|nr:zonadhesin isoform X2 [Nerophis ophidion]